MSTSAPAAMLPLTTASTTDGSAPRHNPRLLANTPTNTNPAALHTPTTSTPRPELRVIQGPQASATIPRALTLMRSPSGDRMRNPLASIT